MASRRLMACAAAFLALAACSQDLSTRGGQPGGWHGPAFGDGVLDGDRRLRIAGLPGPEHAAERTLWLVAEDSTEPVRVENFAELMPNVAPDDLTRAARLLELWREVHDHFVRLADDPADGVRSRRVGRQRAAEPFMREALQLLEVQQRAADAAACLANLCQVNLYLGELDEGLLLAERCAGVADGYGDPAKCVIARTVRGDALHQLGCYDEALKAFAEAEEVLAAALPGHGMQSFEGLRYCDVLLTLGRYEEVISRLEALREWGDGTGVTIDERVLLRVSLGKAYVAAYRALHRPQDAQAAAEHLDAALHLFRGAESEHLLPYGLLTRADLRGLLGEHVAAMGDVQRCIDRSRGEMALHVVDAHVLRLKLLNETNAEECARELAAVGEMVERMNYGRRREDLRALSETIDRRV